MFRCSPASAQTSIAHPPTGTSAQTTASQTKVEKRISALHSQLKITAAEEPLWQQFADAMRQNAQRMNQSAVERAQKLQSMNAVQSLKSYADLVVERGQDLQRRATAFENLYNAMAPDQQKLADQVFRRHAAPKHHHH